MEKKEKKSEISSTEAVLLGALAPGVNAPTWSTLKFAFLLLGLCLAFMLSVAFTSGQSMLLVHVGFLIIIASTLFILLNWFLAQTGLVSVETQMQELNLAPTDKSK
uniref:Transmembrane protein n=1 Tax=Noccaea caerulescens TaxID=107243 RepID=A0A1J3K5A9_NOCCA